MANLITLQQYKDFAGIKGLNEDAKLNVIIPSISQAVKTYCGTSFVDFLLFKNARDKWRACGVAWRTPARFPGHLPYDPFQFVAMSFPVHGSRRNVCAKGSHAAYQVFAFHEEVSQFCFRQCSLLGLLMDQGTDIVTRFA